jgi:glycine/D-amino acid oxidase-like deaminating enzyme
LHWFALLNEESANKQLFLPANFPIYIWEFQQNMMFYGFPDVGTGIKIACHHFGSPASANTIERDVNANEIAVMKSILENHFAAKVNHSHSGTCIYTNTPDQNFIIDYHPHNPNIIIASACSGHGFKFSSATGKVLSEMASGRDLSVDLSLFKIKKFL